MGSCPVDLKNQMVGLLTVDDIRAIHEAEGVTVRVFYFCDQRPVSIMAVGLDPDDNEPRFVTWGFPNDSSKRHPYIMSASRLLEMLQAEEAFRREGLQDRYRAGGE